MGKTVKTIIGILIIALIAYLIYYFYNKQKIAKSRENIIKGILINGNKVGTVPTGGVPPSLS